MEPSAHIRQDGMHVLMVTHRERPFDTSFTWTLDLDPRQMRYIWVKMAAHFRAGFEAWADAIYVAGEPSVHDSGNLTFHRLRRKLNSMDDI